jgi:hypothetical protein
MLFALGWYHVLKKILLSLLYLLTVSACLEGTARIYYYSTNGSFSSPITKIANKNIILRDRYKHKCSWSETLAPHPHLSHFHFKIQDCDLPESILDINSQGLWGQMLPEWKSNQTFDIILTGGSVASFLGQMYKGGPRFLEEALNNSYTSPTGKPFRVFNIADGDWQQPAQLVVLGLYGHRASGIVSLEGFNEHWRFTAGTRLFSPGTTFSQLVAPSLDSRRQLAAEYIVGTAERKMLATPLIRDSLFVYALYDLLRKGMLVYSASDENTDNLTKAFAFPSTLGPGERYRWNMELYKNLLRVEHAMAEALGIKVAFFIQPVPRIGKDLTDEELSVITPIRYEEVYQDIVKNLTQLQNEKIFTHSLLDVFSKEEKTIYKDMIHPNIDASGEGKGYRLIANAMADELARAWGLVRKT